MSNQDAAAAQLTKELEAFLQTQSAHVGNNDIVQSDPRAIFSGASGVVGVGSRDTEEVEHGSYGRQGRSGDKTNKVSSRRGDGFVCGEEDEAKVAELVGLLQDDNESRNFSKETR